MDDKVAFGERFLMPALSEAHPRDVVWGPDARETLRRNDEQRLAGMDEAGVELAVLALAEPSIQAEVDTDVAVARARTANDALGEIVAARPDRYIALAAVPLQSPTAAADELERCVIELGFRGAAVNGVTSAGDGDPSCCYDDPRYLPFWERVCDLGVPLYLRAPDPPPSQRRGDENREAVSPLSSAWEHTAQTATQVLRLMACGLFDVLPTLQIVVGHIGELLPFVVLHAARGSLTRTLTERRRTPEQMLAENLWLTMSDECDPILLLAAMLRVGTERLLFATDHPLRTTVEAAARFDAAPVSATDRSKIGRTNALRVLKAPGRARRGGEAVPGGFLG